LQYVNNEVLKAKFFSFRKHLKMAGLAVNITDFTDFPCV